MNTKLIPYVALGWFASGCAYASSPTIIPASLSLSGRTAGVAAADENAEFFDNRLLSPSFCPPKNSRFILIPRVGKTDCDLMRCEYRSGPYTVVISQVSDVLLVQVFRPASQSAILPLGQVRELLGSVFSGNIDGAFTIHQHGQTTAVTDPNGKPPWWWQKPYVLADYCIKAIPNSPRPVMMAIPLMAHWYTERTAEERTAAADLSNAQDLIFSQMLAAEPNAAQRAKALAWNAAHLTAVYQPPAGLEFVTLPPSRFPSLTAVQMRFVADEKVITITQSTDLNIVQVEDIGHGPKPFLSEEKIEDLCHKIFANSTDAHAASSKETDTESEGTISAPVSGKATWLNALAWWQEQGRVIFYCKNNGK